MAGDFGVKRTRPKPQDESAPAKPWQGLRSNLLTLLTLIGIVSGIIFGCIMRNYKEVKWTQREQMYVKFGGEIFLRMLSSLTLPLLLTSVIAALGSLDLRLSGKIGMRTFFSFLLTTILAVFLGIVLVITIRPGIHHENENLPHNLNYKPRKVLNADVMMDMIRNMFPSNLLKATLYQDQTIVDVQKIQDRQRRNESFSEDDIPTKANNFEGTNMLGILVFSTAFGLALSSVGTYGKPVLKLFKCLSQLMLILTNWVLWLAPAGIFCLLVEKIIEAKQVEETFSTTMLYVTTVLLGLIVHCVMVLPIMYFVITGSHPYKLFVDALESLVMAFGTSSSFATLPATISCVEEKHGVDPRVARFVLPLGSAVNMDGTALYEAVAAIFLVQLHGMPMDFTYIIEVCLISIIASIGASGIPQAGLVTMSMFANVLGLPMDSILILIPVDFLLDRFRTATNVFGDTLVASLVDRLSKDDLDGLDKLPLERICSRQILTSSVEDV